MKHKTIKIKNKIISDDNTSCSIFYATCHKGFSFVEVMISVFLVSIGMIAVISLMNSNLSNSIDSRDQVIAATLAQEGTELVRNIRDNNWLAHPNDIETYSFEYITTRNDCRIDKNQNPAVSIACGDAYDLKIDDEGFYAHSGPTETKFQRRMIISNNGNNKDVINLVSWDGNPPPSTTADCNTINKCAYTKIILSKSGNI